MVQFYMLQLDYYLSTHFMLPQLTPQGPQGPSLYCRTLPCGHLTFVDTPPLWTPFTWAVCFPYIPLCIICGPWPHLVSLEWTPCYCGHCLSGPRVSTLPRFYCPQIVSKIGFIHGQLQIESETHSLDFFCFFFFENY